MTGTHEEAERTDDPENEADAGIATDLRENEEASQDTGCSGAFYEGVVAQKPPQSGEVRLASPPLIACSAWLKQMSGLAWLML